MPSSARPPQSLEAIVLRRTLFGEADLIVSLLTHELGRVSALAKSARKSVRRFSGGLGVGIRGQAKVRDRPQADLILLESFEILDPRLGFSMDLAKSAHAAYALELCDRLCPPRQPEPRIFAWLEDFLTRVDGEEVSATRLRVFELGLLARLGFEPRFTQCQRCGRGDFNAEDVFFVPHDGGIYCQRCHSAGTRVSDAVRRTLLRLAKDNLTGFAELNRETNKACRQITWALLGEHLQSPLRSLEFMEKISGASSTSR